MGDFNLDLIKFNQHKPTEDFLDSMFSFGFLPTITKPTRIHGAATLIDNIFTSSQKILQSGIILNDISDHNMTFTIEEVFTNSNEDILLKPALTKKNIDIFCNTLSNSNWDFVLENNDVQKSFDYFYDKINETADFAFPLKLLGNLKL